MPSNNSGMNMNNFMGMKKNNVQTQSEINDKYKTERCRHYETHKNCALGDKCHFAHGDTELRKPGDSLSTEQLELAVKSQQWLNCHQANQQRFTSKGKPGQGSGGSMRGGMK
jgi:hypothetical protein